MYFYLKWCFGSFAWPTTFVTLTFILTRAITLFSPVQPFLIQIYKICLWNFHIFLFFCPRILVLFSVKWVSNSVLNKSLLNTFWSLHSVLRAENPVTSVTHELWAFTEPIVQPCSQLVLLITDGNLTCLWESSVSTVWMQLSAKLWGLFLKIFLVLGVRNPVTGYVKECLHHPSSCLALWQSKLQLSRLGLSPQNEASSWEGRRRWRSCLSGSWGERRSFIFQIKYKIFLRPDIGCSIELRTMLVIEKDHNSLFYLKLTVSNSQF